MNYSELAQDIMQHDISYWCSRYWIPGYEKEDLEQECRMALWKASKGFNHDRGVMVRTWANTVIKNRLRELLRNSYYDCRSVGHKLVHEIDNVLCQEEDIDSILSILIENNMTLDDLL